MGIYELFCCEVMSLLGEGGSCGRVKCCMVMHDTMGGWGGGGLQVKFAMKLLVCTCHLSL